MSSRVEVKHIFISHSADADKKEAAKLREWLKAAYENVEVFVSSFNSIECGDEPMRALIEGLNKTDALILLMTPAATQSFWVVFEAGFIFGKFRKQTKQHNVLPIVCKGAKISQLPKPIQSLMQAKDISEEEGLEQAVAKLDSILKQTHIKSIEPLRDALSQVPPVVMPFAIPRPRYEDRTIM